MSRLGSKSGGQQMKVIYDKLWKLMIDKKPIKQSFVKKLE